MDMDKWLKERWIKHKQSLNFQLKHMIAIATQKFIRMSPRKLRVIAREAKKMKPEYAAEVLPMLGRMAGVPIQKVVKTAIANAVIKGMDQGNLSFVEIQIGEGPRLKRFRAGARGQAKPYTRDMAHIRVVLTDDVKGKKSEPKVKEEIVNEVKKSVKTTKKGSK